jgi:hypothetical protein
MIIDDSMNYWLIALGAICHRNSVLIRFAGTFEINLKNKIKSAIDYKNSKLVLLKEKILPHTFLYTSTKQITIIEKLKQNYIHMN